MMRVGLLFIFFLILCSSALAQTKVSGVIVDDNGEPVPFANVIFKNSIKGTITNENGRFYLEAPNAYNTLVISFVGYTTREFELTKKVSYDLSIVLSIGEVLDEVVVYVGRQSKKNNPAIDILRKIWSHKRRNGVLLYDQYEYDKYEKVEFDLNTIDSALIKSKLFRGLEFMFKDLDTSRITGKTYLPMFINEAITKVYGDNVRNKFKEDLLGNKNSGFSSNETIIAFVQDLYSEYDVYDNYLKFFDKSFTSPLSRTGIDTYNYVLNDSAYIDNKWCYHIIYYPRRKNELTFKGDFWVNDTTFAVKKINLQVTKSANINWVKDVYIEQEFDVLNDSVLLLKRDYMLSDFSFNKKEKSRGIYGKRTTVYDNHKFDVKKPPEFYDRRLDPYETNVFEREDEFWENNRLEELNADEAGIYALLDTLKTVPKFKRLYNLGSILSSGYIEISKLKLDYGPIFSTFGYNDVEGLRLRAGGRTYFGRNDPWRLEGYTAYGFRDSQFKYGLSGKWLLDRQSRLIVSGGTRRDVEQTGVSLTATTDVLGRSFASSALFASGDNSRLTNINLSTAKVEVQPWKNFRVAVEGSYRTLKTASPSTFSLDYIDPQNPANILSNVKQSEITTTLTYTPGLKTLGYGVELNEVNDEYPTFFVRYGQGIDGITDFDFNYSKLQLYGQVPMQIGGFGRLVTTLEVGKTFGEVPLGLLSVIPGNQSSFSIYNTFPLLNYYEFVTDTYTSLHLEHNFNGRLFSRIPWLRKLNLREIVAIRGVWGEISQANVDLNRPAFDSLTFNTVTPSSIAPNDEIYWDYSVGIGNIFKVMRIDFNFRGNYFDNPDARRTKITIAFGFHF